MSSRPIDIRDLIGTAVLERFQQEFSEVFGFNVAFTGLDYRTVGSQGRNVWAGTVCELLKQTDQGQIICNESDDEGGKEALKRKRLYLFRCHCYFSNFIIPVFVSKDIRGFIYGGQFFCMPPAYDSQGKLETGGKVQRQKTRNKEQKEWNEFIEESKAFVAPRKGEWIHGGFFHRDDSPIDSEMLDGIAEQCSLDPDRDKEFCRLYQMQLDEKQPENRRKTVKEIRHAIKVLSAVANAFSEECNRGLALKTQSKIVGRLMRRRSLKGKMLNRCIEMGRMIDDFMDSESRPQDEPQRKIEDILQKAIQICVESFQREKKRLRWREPVCRFFFMPFLYNRRRWQELSVLPPHTGDTNMETPLLELEAYYEQLDTIGYRLDKVKEMMKNPAGPLTWIGGIAGITYVVVAIMGLV